MTLPSGPSSISVGQINVEIERAAQTFSTDLNFLNSKIKPAQRPATPNMNSFKGTTYYQRNMDGNCNNKNCTVSNDSTTGNIATRNCRIKSTVNCTNCDTEKLLQTNCNCACTYNCTICNGGTRNCNCECHCAWSDDRLKTRKNTIENALAIVRRLEGFYYKGNELAVSMGLGNEIDIGVSAQKIKEEFPVALGPNIPNTDLMQVRYEKLVPLLIEAIKQLDDKFEKNIK